MIWFLASPMSLQDTHESIAYLTERYIEPHVKRTTVNNQKFSAQEAKELVKKGIAMGLIGFRARAAYELDQFQKNRIIDLRARGETIGTVAYRLDVPYETVRDFVKENKL